jgi:hypothetical protein
MIGGTKKKNILDTLTTENNHFNFPTSPFFQKNNPYEKKGNRTNRLKIASRILKKNK